MVAGTQRCNGLGKVQASVARCLRTPPYVARRKGLDLVLRTAYAASATGARLSLATIMLGPVTVVPHRAKANPFRRPSILFRPHDPANVGVMVEPPGTAPGSEPLITSAFIAIASEEAHQTYANGPRFSSALRGLPPPRRGVF